MQNLIETVVRSIVEDLDSLRVLVSENQYQTVLTVQASEKDVGRLLGKKGRTIQAIRNLVDLIGQKDGTHYSIWVEENMTGLVQAK